VYRAWRALSPFLLGAIIACSKLPDYAAPQASMSQRSEIDLSDVIGYRPLERADFKGSKAPLASEEDSKKLDLDTSVAMNPKKQAEWRRIAEGELEALSARAVP
jgi:hypothetical protein